MREKTIYVYVDNKQHELIKRVAGAYGMSLGNFCRQAALEKALGQKADASTTELVMEIQIIKDLLAQRDKNAGETRETMTVAANIDTTGTGIPEEEIKGKVLHVLAASPPLNSHDLAKATGYPEKLVFLCLSKLVDAGLVALDERCFEYRMVR